MSDRRWTEKEQLSLSQKAQGSRVKSQKEGGKKRVRKRGIQIKSWPLVGRGRWAALGSFPPFHPYTQPSLLEHLFSTLFLGCEAGDGPDFDLNPIVELFPPHVPDTLIRGGNGPVLGIGRGGVQVSLSRAR